MLKVSSTALLLVSVVFGLNACSGDADPMEQSDFERSGGSGTYDDLLYPPVVEQGASEPPVEYTYAEAPYGYRMGTVAPDTAFRGWRSPGESEFDPAQVETIRLSDYYDPDGSKGIKLIYVISSAEWCPPCRAEYNHFNSAGVADEYRAKGVVFLGTLFQDAQATPQPADYATGKRWGERYEVVFPFAIDPAHAAGTFADTGSIPFNFILDAKTMKMVETITGFGAPSEAGGKSSTESTLDVLLRERCLAGGQKWNETTTTCE